MLSLTPGMPGRREQMPRQMMSMRTPAWLARYSAFKLVDHVTEVFGDWYGDAPEKWVRTAVKDLHRRGLTDCKGTGQIRDLVLTRPPQADTSWRSGIAS